MTVFLAFLVPDFGFNARWKQGYAVVEQVPQDQPGAEYFRVGDIIVAVDDHAVAPNAFRPIFWPIKSRYAYTIERDGETLTMSAPVRFASGAVLGSRMVTGAVGLLAWLTAALVLLAAGRNRDSSLLTMAILINAIVLVASDAQAYNVPGGALLGDPLLVFASVVFANIAMLPNSRDTWHGWRNILAVLYACAIGLGLASLYEVLWLRPHHRTLLQNWNIRWVDVIALFVAIGLILNLLILLSRLRTERTAYVRRQVSIVLMASAIAVAPIVVFAIVPTLVTGHEFLPWELTLLMLFLIPLAYGYVIVRHKYLGLDIQATRLLSLLLVAISVILLYMVFYFALVRRPALQALEPLPTTTYLALAMIIIVPFVSKVIRQSVERVVFGPDIGLETALVDFTRRLSAAPSLETMQQVLTRIGQLLEADRISLLVLNNQGKTVSLSHPADLEVGWHESLRHLPEQIFIKAAGADRVFALYPWAAAITPLYAKEELVGVLIVGGRIDGGYFDGRQVLFIEQVAQILAVAGSVFRLIESIRSLTRDIVTVREMERLQLSTRLHDEPLQVVALATGALRHVLDEAQTSTESKLELERSLGWLSQAASQLRDICAGLYPPVVDEGVASIVRGLAKDFRVRTGLSAQVSILLQGDSVNNDVRRAIYHVLKESLSNVVKHANASVVEIEVEQHSNSIQLHVADNGSGLPTAFPSSGERLKGQRFGIVNMQEWSILVNGRLEINARPGGGTAVNLEVPLSPGESGCKEAGSGERV